MLPESLFDVVIRSSQVGFYCSYGHALHFDENAGKQRRAQQTADVVKLHVVKNDDEKPA